MPKELEDHYHDVYPAARNAPCPQQLHYYDERRRPQFANRFDRGDMGAPYFPYESWSASGRSYFPRPGFEYGPGSPFVRDAYGRSGVDVYRPQRNDYHRHDTEERDFRSPSGTRDGSVERERGERKRRHRKSSKHRHRRSRHHRRHKRSKHAEMHSDSDHANDLPSLTLGAEITRGRRHVNSIAETSAPGSDISGYSSPSQSVGEPSDSIGASVTLSPVASAVPAVNSGHNIENDEGEVDENDDGEVAELTASVVAKQESTEESDDGSSSDAESLSKKSRSSTSSSESGSPDAKKHRTRLQPVTKVRSSYATALAAKLRQNRLALEERSCRRPDTSSARLQPSDGSPSVIDKSSVNTETSRLCSDSNLVIDNSLNVERVVTANRQAETSSINSVVSCSAPLRVNSSTQLSVSQSATHRESHSTASLNWYVTKIVYLCCHYMQ